MDAVMQSAEKLPPFPCYLFFHFPSWIVKLSNINSGTVRCLLTEDRVSELAVILLVLFPGSAL